MLLLKFRLSCHYDVKDQGSYQTENASNSCQREIIIEEITTKSEQFFKSQGQVPPTKVMLSKLLNNMFKVYGGPRRNGQAMVYPELIEKMKFCVPNSTLTFRVPEDCKVEQDSKLLKVKCLREWVVNDERISCSVEFSDNTTTFCIHGRQIPLGIYIRPTTLSIEGLIRVLKEVQICKGLKEEKYMKDSLPSAIREVWLEVEGTSFYNVSRVRSPSCDVMMSSIGSSETCKNCHNLVWTHVRRTNENDNTAKERPKKKLKIEKSLDEIEILKDILPEGVPELLSLLIQSQIQNCDVRRKQKRRWDPKILSACLSVYRKSVFAYKALCDSGLLLLPTRAALEEYRKSK